MIDESWFKILDAEINFMLDQITSTTVNKCKNRPNIIFSLSNDDKNRIKKHVDYTLNKCQIRCIKRVQTNPKNDNDYKTVTFFEKN